MGDILADDELKALNDRVDNIKNMILALDIEKVDKNSLAYAYASNDNLNVMRYLEWVNNKKTGRISTSNYCLINDRFFPDRKEIKTRINNIKIEIEKEYNEKKH